MKEIKLKTSGYSGKPLSEKLGLKPHHKIFIKNPPENFNLIIEQNEFKISSGLIGSFNQILFFTTSYKFLMQIF